jgi:hypothetical protein
MDRSGCCRSPGGGGSLDVSVDIEGSVCDWLVELPFSHGRRFVLSMISYVGQAVTT